MRNYPDTLPQPSWPSYTLSPVEQSIRTDMEVGDPKLRRITFAERDITDLEMRMKDAELAAFRLWFRDSAYSLTGDSDDLTTFTANNSTITADLSSGPDGQFADRIIENTATQIHAATMFFASGIAQNGTVVFRATLKAGGRSFCRVTFSNWAGTLGFVWVDLAAGTLGSQSGLISAAIKSRGNGWYRVEATMATGTGASTPFFRLNLSADGSAITYLGNGSGYIDACEQQVRMATGYDLFLPTDSAGNITGAAGGSAWFGMSLPAGGGLSAKQVRFIGTYAANPLQGLNWSVKAKALVR